MINKSPGDGGTDRFNDRKNGAVRKQSVGMGAMGKGKGPATTCGGELLGSRGSICGGNFCAETAGRLELGLITGIGN